ncbi:hypothetical protein SAGO17_0087 [Mimivirus AB-566-O17]|uniref:Uncharacterized protein n=1 Tax=Mimivirus AB-566-O17 TaxID=1988039 RepID=A0A1X9VNU3_9VIRU|nr:hypothetical protein SAGO17_0087 [Mimivirus AB-566-O17]
MENEYYSDSELDVIEENEYQEELKIESFSREIDELSYNVYYIIRDFNDGTRMLANNSLFMFEEYIRLVILSESNEYILYSSTDPRLVKEFLCEYKDSIDANYRLLSGMIKTNVDYHTFVAFCVAFSDIE